MKTGIRKIAIFMAATVLAHGPAQASAADWSMAEIAYDNGRAAQTKPETKEALSQCAGYWMLHTDAVDDGAFSVEALSLLPEALGRVQSELTTIQYRATGVDQTIYRASANRAEKQLRRALQGDGAALQAYFEALGGCAVGAE